MSNSLKVGIIGASAEGGWAQVSHVPAVQALVGLELAAVATQSQETADAAARAFGVKAAFGDAMAMVRDPSLDIVSVCVKAPAHKPLVLAALEAGKHVYCEWPLGRDTAEAEEMARAAHKAGVHAVVGLQTRGNPAARRARELIVSGAIGRVLSARVTSATIAFGPTIPSSMAYAEDPASGVSLETIQGAHTVDFAIAVLGYLEDMSALLTTQFPKTEIGEAREPRARSTPDHVLVLARVTDGAALSIEVAGGRPPETPFHLEVIGESGVLTIEGGAPRGFQSGRLRLSLKGVPERLDDGELAGLPDEVTNVAGLYARLRDDIAEGISSAPDFAHAVRLARLVDEITASSRSGARRTAADWPAPL